MFKEIEYTYFRKFNQKSQPRIVSIQINTHKYSCLEHELFYCHRFFKHPEKSVFKVTILFLF